MGIVRDGDKPNELIGVTAEDLCFYCGEQLGLPFVYWAGYRAKIGLHYHCALELQSRLAFDAIACRDGVNTKQVEAPTKVHFNSPYFEDIAQRDPELARRLRRQMLVVLSSNEQKREGQP